MTNIEKIKKQYDDNIYMYKKLCEEVYHQIKEVINQNNIKLAVPIEYRVKELSSIILKVEKSEDINNLSEINDVAGIRVITVFEKDVESVCNIIQSVFYVLRKEDTRNRLSDNQFGYGSIHFEIKLKDEWCEVPSLSSLKGLKLELQVRTAAQHIWAISSHILQYKKESNVPEKVKRSINRVAALLELVDLEYTRALEEQSEYIKEFTLEDINEDSLNIENLKLILKSKLPSKNEDVNEGYSELLDHLAQANINTTSELILFIDQNLEIMLSEELEAVKHMKQKRYRSNNRITSERFEKGVFFTHAGLIRTALRIKFKMNFEKTTEVKDNQ